MKSQPNQTVFWNLMTKPASPVANLTNLFFNHSVPILSEPIRCLQTSIKGKKTSTDSLLRLRKKNAPLNTYEEMHEWRFTANDWMTSANNLKDMHGHISRKKMYKKLQIWHDMPTELGQTQQK